MHGLLVVDKPTGMTSHDVVARLRRISGQRRIGHSGTLDPIATGVLVVCLGAATKAMPYLPEGEKTYQVEAVLGIATDTQDRTGRTIAEEHECAVSVAVLREAMERMTGSSTQIPPMYSAVKIGGERLYRKARAGREIERAPRPIYLRELRLERPLAGTLRCGDRFEFTVTGSKGLYVRTLCHDLGISLGCGAHLAELRRTASGPFTLDTAVPLAELTAANMAARLMSIGEALAHLPAVRLDRTAMIRIMQGQTIPCGNGSSCDLARAVADDGRTVAIVQAQEGLWRPRRVFQYS